jgi:hypothetical protein
MGLQSTQVKGGAEVQLHDKVRFIADGGVQQGQVVDIPNATTLDVRFKRRNIFEYIWVSAGNVEKVT